LAFYHLFARAQIIPLAGYGYVTAHLIDLVLALYSGIFLVITAPTPKHAAFIGISFPRNYGLTRP
jgi:hypothetical protein